MTVDSLTATGLGVNSLNVTGEESINATAAIETIKEEINTKRILMRIIYLAKINYIQNISKLIQNANYLTR